MTLPIPADPSSGLLATVLDLNPAAVALLRPQYEEAALQDFAWVYLNPAGQQALQLPAVPPASLGNVFPGAGPAGVLAFCRRAFQDSPGPVQGHSGAWHLTAQRENELLVVYFTDPDKASEATTAAALRESRDDEQVARAEAEQQRQRFQEVLTQLPAYVAVYQGPDHIYQFVNPLYQSRFPHRSFLGRPFREGTPESVDLGVVAIFDRVYQTGEPVYLPEMEGWFDFHSTGEPEQIFLNLILQPLRDAQGRVSGILDFSYSVTEQVRARQQVEQLNRELEARVQERSDQLALAHAAGEVQRTQLEALFMQAPAAICVLSGPEWVYELVNPIYQAAFPGRPLLGQPLLAALPELHDSIIPGILRRVYATGEPFQADELPVRLARTPDGPVLDRLWSFTYQPRRDMAGRVDGVLVFGYDVTEAVHARQAVDATRQQLRLVTDALPVLIGYLDREQRYQFANHAYQRWFDQDPQLLLGRLVREVVGEAAYAATRGYMERALAGERLSFEARMPYREDFVKHIRTDYIPDVRAGHVVGFYTLVLDITDQVVARERVEAAQRHTEELLAILQKTNAELSRVNADLDHFVYTASHDLKAPIVNIEGLLQVLREELALPPAQAETAIVLRLMDDAVHRFQHTLRQLTDVTRLQQLPAPVVPVDVREVVAGIELDLQPLLLTSGGQITLEADSCPTLLLPEKHVRSLLYNFISNGLKYRHPDRAPRVRVQCQADEQATVLAVTDNGLGLTPAQQQQVFGLFQRQHSHVDGSGVGLYLVRQLVEGAGGQVELDSQYGVGSTFRVVLPPAQATILPPAS